MQYFLENPAHLWFLIAGLSFVIELSIMGLSGPLLFFAIASLMTGILVNIDLLDSWQMQVLAVGILTAITAIILWKPLKQLQNPRTTTDTSSDMIGLKVPASADITTTSGSIRYSGINWSARLAEDCGVDKICNTSLCVIVAISGNTMLVKLV
ncbi:acriflavin resistance protein [Colwellia sp. 39_35_sub15_T18]|nr:acriflavin resistance protein [Colwellia sp. 39_35_sub15_T18]